MSPSDSTGACRGLPSHFDPSAASDPGYCPDPESLLAAAQDWRSIERLTPVSQDSQRTVLLLVDVQRDFCHPEGALYVAGLEGGGAVADSARTAEFLYRNLAQISEVVCTLDSHHPHQIFFSSFWLDRSGSPPPPNTTISSRDVEQGLYRPNPNMVPLVAAPDLEWLERQVLDYCRRLEESGRHQLFLWPPHCLVGSSGHALVGVVDEARLFHCFAREAESVFVTKGEALLTENYSVLAPEVEVAHDGARLGTRDQKLIDRLLAADRLIVAGQAASHCVAETVFDLLAEIQRCDPALAGKVYLLQDCMSAVTVSGPDGSLLADFTSTAEEMFERARQAGMHVVRSTVPMAQWPGSLPPTLGGKDEASPALTL